MVKEIDFEKFNFWKSRGPVTFDLDLESGHTAYHHASLIDVYIHTKFQLKSDKLFVEGRTDGRT